MVTKRPILLLLLVCICAALTGGCGSRETPARQTQTARETESAQPGSASKSSDRKEQAKPAAVEAGPRPTASQLLRSVRKSYLALKSLRQEGVSTNIVRADGKIVGKPRLATVSVLFKRPNRFVIVTDGGRLVSDGKTVYSYSPTAKQYVKGAPEDAVRNLIASRAGIGTMGLLYGAKYDKAIGTSSLLPDSKLNGRDTYVLALKLKTGIGCPANVQGLETLWIDKKDLGLRRMQIILAYKPRQTKSAKGQTPKLIESTTTTELKNFEANTRMPDSAFAFKPPAGAKLVEPPKPVDLSNKPAPEFLFAWTDGTPKKLSAFRGKVVVLGFWALPMCEPHLPVLQSLSASLGAETQLITVNLNGDQAAVQDYLNKNGCTFPVVYADPGMAKMLAERYMLKGLPSMFIIDSQGIVRRSLFGMPSQKEIEAKLAQIASGSSPPSASE